MRLHRSETAFFLFMALILVICVLMLLAYRALTAADVDDAIAHDLASRMMFGGAVLNAAAVIFGLFFIFPLIRTQVREEGKLRAMTETLSARSVTFEHAALTDGLTGMRNRRYFDDALREYLDEFRRIDKPVGLMILDLDNFKAVNDTHGHDVGDRVLRAVATCVREFTRYHDVAARLGGEEFAVVAPNLDEGMLVKLADRIRAAIANLSVPTGNVTLRVTASVGLAVWDRDETAEEFFRRADRKLYQAKRQGRNRVCA